MAATEKELHTGPNFLDQEEFDPTNNEPVETPDQRVKSIYRNINILRAKYKSNPVWSQEDEVARVMIVCEILKMVHDGKSQTYGPSWKKRGWVASIFSNIGRKFDRLETIFTNASMVMKFVEKPDPSNTQEQIVDTFADLAVYGLLATTEIMITKPEMFDQWLKNSGIK
jgi:hypothetical protein